MQTVAVIVQDGAEPFGLGSLVEVWGESYHPEDQNPVFDFRVCTPRPGRVRGRSDFDMYVERGLEATLDADLVCLAPKHDFMDHDPAVQEAVRAAADRGAILYAARRSSSWARSGCSTAASAPPTGATPICSRRASRRRRSGPTSSTATTATC